VTEDQARTTANVLMAAAALGAEVIVLRHPTLRRLAWQLARAYASGPLAAGIAAIVRDAWDHSAPAGGMNTTPDSRDATERGDARSTSGARARSGARASV
jgi:hypothetical protein